MDVCPSEITEQILMFGTQTRYEVTWLIEYFLSLGNEGEAADRSQ